MEQDQYVAEAERLAQEAEDAQKSFEDSGIVVGRGEIKSVDGSDDAILAGIRKVRGRLAKLHPGAGSSGEIG